MKILHENFSGYMWGQLDKHRIFLVSFSPFHDSPVNDKGLAHYPIKINIKKV